MIAYHQIYLRHLQSPSHPESPERLNAIVKKLKEENLFNDVILPEKATVEELTKIHTKEHIEKIKNFGEGYYDMDTAVHEETYEIACFSSKGAIISAKYSYEKNKPSFALIRPPGHHAGRNYAGGFCYFNNIAIATKNLPVRKSAIVDLDLHHGNGTSDIFYNTDEVLFISTHQQGIYPGTGHADEVGKGKGEGFNINIPLVYGSGDATFELAYEKLINPILTQYSPEIILVSLGGDSHYADPLGGLTLSSAGYVNLVKKIISSADEICNGRICFVLEGGYNVSALAEVVCGIIASFEGKEIKYKFNEVKDKYGTGKENVYKSVEIQRKYWIL